MSDQYPPPPPPPGEYPPPPPPGDAGSSDTLPARGLGDILSAAWQIYTKNARQLLLIVAIIVVPLSIISYLLADVLFAPKTHDVLIGQRSVEIIEPRSFFIFLLAVLVAAAISVIITAVLQAAILRAAAQATINDPVDVEASYRWGLRKFGGVLAASILVGLSVAVGFILLIIPGIILLVLLSVTVPALVVENLRATEAMRRSWDLVKGHFWHVFGIILVAALITGIVGGLIGAIGGSNTLLRLIFGAIAQILVAPFSALVTVLLYLDVRARKENLTASALRGQLTTAG